ncbi:MAG: hypothetical protein ACOCQN_00810 [Halanaerobiaceae bacterium]
MIHKYLKKMAGAVLLMVSAWIITFLMVLDVIESVFIINLLVFVLASTGLFFGFWIILNILQERREKS